MASTADTVALIRAKRTAIPPERALLVAISGIDGAGKGYITQQISSRLTSLYPCVVTINVDGWLSLPGNRFSQERPAEHFYENGIRFAEMFEECVLPLKQHRSHRVEVRLADATNAGQYRQHVYDFKDVDIVLLEGIFLLKRAFRVYYDLAIWVDCTFETALDRALRRGQEGLPPEQAMADYERIYFPAQRMHLEKDNPRQAADVVIVNDGRLPKPAN
jgi:uridine kinase